MSSSALIGFTLIGITTLVFVYSGEQSRLISAKDDLSAAIKNYETDPFYRTFMDEAQQNVSRHLFLIPF